MKEKKKKDIQAAGPENTAEGTSKKPEEKSTKKPDASTESSKYKYLIKNRQVLRHTRQHKIVVALMIFLGVTIALGGAVYGIISFLNYNNFQVLIDKEGMNILSLSNRLDFSNPTEVLALGGPRYMDNITLMDIYYLIPEFEAHEGAYGEGDNTKYIAATFFLKNITSKDRIYREAVIIDDVTKNVDDALRVMIIRDGERTVYAKAKPDQTPEEVVPGQFFTRQGIPDTGGEVWMAEPFISPRHVCYNTGLPLAAGQIVKYTVLIWLEGWDDECVDAILGGTIKLELQFAQHN